MPSLLRTAPESIASSRGSSAIARSPAEPGREPAAVVRGFAAQKPGRSAELAKAPAAVITRSASHLSCSRVLQASFTCLCHSADAHSGLRSTASPLSSLAHTSQSRPRLCRRSACLCCSHWLRGPARACGSRTVAVSQPTLRLSCRWPSWPLSSRHDRNLRRAVAAVVVGLCMLQYLRALQHQAGCAGERNNDKCDAAHLG